jgi:hypothetical protein
MKPAPTEVPERHRRVLEWIGEGCPDDGRWPDETHKITARVLSGQGLLKITRPVRGGRKAWHAELTSRGQKAMTVTEALEAPVRDVARITVTSQHENPSDLNMWAYATEAWQVWDMLSRRRQTVPHQDEFTPQRYDGQPGYTWDQSMAEAIRLRHGLHVTQHVRKMMTDWLTATDNAVNVGGRGIAARWWFPVKWNDVRPKGAQPAPRPSSPAPAVFRPPTPAGAVKCRWCASTGPSENAVRKHEASRHPAEYRNAAEFLCTVIVSGEPCGDPFPNRKGIGRHLSMAHGIESAAERDRIAVSAAAAAARHQQAVTAADELPELGAEIAATEPVVTEVREPAVPAQPELEAATPVPPPAPALAPAPATPQQVQATAPDIPGLLAAVDQISAFLRDLGPNYTQIQESLEAERARADAERERAEAAERRLGEFSARLNGLLDLATSS